MVCWSQPEAQQQTTKCCHLYCCALVLSPSYLPLVKHIAIRSSLDIKVILLPFIFHVLKFYSISTYWDYVLAALEEYYTESEDEGPAGPPIEFAAALDEPNGISSVILLKCWVY